MKKLILLIVLPLMINFVFGQQKEEAEKLVAEGISYHDKGDYEGALTRYDKALQLDKDNLSALAEKAYTLSVTEKYNDAIVLCRLAIDKHPGDEYLPTVYVTYGNSLDALKKTDSSIAIYNVGIKQFPDYYQLHFNKGITLSSVKRYDEAIECFQQSLKLSPRHPGSHNAIARSLYYKNKRIPSLLAFCRFLILEPQTDRAKENLQYVQKIMNGNIEQTGKKSITINISPSMLADTTADGKPKENSFSTTDLILAMDAGLDFDKKNKKNTEVEQFIRKFKTVCSSLAETKKNNYGFYWDYYVPYFTEMNDKGLVETFAYIAFASSDDPDVAKWLKSHKSEVDKFYEWSKSFQWKTN